MDIKSVIAGTAIGAILIGGIWFIYAKNNNKEEILKSEVHSSLEEKVTCEEENKTVLEVISSEKKYFEEWDSENYEVTLKNTSGEKIQKVEISLGEGIYELYNLEPNDEYKIVAYNSETDIQLKVLTINYEIPTYFPDEIVLETSIEGNKLFGKITNNSEIEIYPNQIMIFLRAEDNTIVQKTLEYSGCFFEGLVIKPNQEFEFEIEIPEGHTVLKNKGTMFKYSDLEFKMYEIKNFIEM